jgi:hypothetical protein
MTITGSLLGMCCVKLLSVWEVVTPQDKGEEHMREEERMLCIYIVCTLILVVAIGYYVAHVWTDCLQEHSFLTCMRMLAR